ncbi:MAG: hypothetical protein GX589_08220 [Deltaproteobacteria bacterium]|nr:hypothetical protein [Deltaproteobacteria bacterium]
MDKYLLALMIFTFTALPGLADFSCVASVSYQWKKEGGEPQSVFFINVAGNAADMEAAKVQVSRLADSEKVRARDACMRQHENLSGCISAKFAAESSLLAKLGFSARKSLEEAINADCKSQQGQCLEPVVSEIKCLQTEEAKEEGQDQASKKGKEESSSDTPAKKGK